MFWVGCRRQVRCLGVGGQGGRPLPLRLFSSVHTRAWQRAPGCGRVCAATRGTEGGGCARTAADLLASCAPSRVCGGLGRRPLPLLLLCFFAAVRRSLEDGLSTGVMVAGPRSGERAGIRGQKSRDAGGRGWGRRPPAPIGHVGYRNLPGDGAAPRDGDVGSRANCLCVSRKGGRVAGGSKTETRPV